MIIERVKAGLARAVAEGKTLGREPFDVSLRETVFWLLQAGVSKRQIARQLHISRATVLNIEREFGAEKLVRSTWAMAFVVPIMAHRLPPEMRLPRPEHLQLPRLPTFSGKCDLIETPPQQALPSELMVPETIAQIEVRQPVVLSVARSDDQLLQTDQNHERCSP